MHILRFLPSKLPVELQYACYRSLGVTPRAPSAGPSAFVLAEQAARPGQSIDLAASTLVGHARSMRQVLASDDRIFRLNKKLDELADRGFTSDCLRLAENIKSKPDVRPNLQTYTILIRVLNETGYFEEATSLFNELANHRDLAPDIYVCNEMLKGKILNGEEPYEILAYMHKHGIQQNGVTAEHLLNFATSRQQIELAMLQMIQGESLVADSAKAARRFMLAATELNEPGIALNALRGGDHSSASTVTPELLVALLQSTAKRHFADATEYLWDRAVNSNAMVVDEGTCLDVLGCAARHGLVQLVHECLHMLQSTGVPLGEQHLLPALEAYFRQASMGDALSFLTTMQHLGGAEVVMGDGVVELLKRAIFQHKDAAETLPWGLWMSEATAAQRLEAIDGLAATMGPFISTVHTALVSAACDLMDLPLVRRLLRNPAYHLGSGNYPSARSFAEGIHLAIDGGFLGAGRQIFDESKRAGYDHTEPILLTAELRLSVSSALEQPTDSAQRQGLSAALEILEDLKNLELPGYPTRMTYIWLLKAMSHCIDHRFETVAHEMIRAHHFVPHKIIDLCGPEISERLTQYQHIIALRAAELSGEQVDTG